MTENSTHKNRRPNLLIITRNFPPLIGGMERLTYHTYDALRESYQCSLVGPRGSANFIQPDINVAECTLYPLTRFLTEAWIKSFRVSKKQRPDLVIAASGLMAPAALAVSRCHKAPVITVVHGLDLIIPHPVYQAAFLPAIRRSDIVIANSRNTMQLAQKVGVAAEKIEILYPGVALPRPPVVPAATNMAAAQPPLRQTLDAIQILKEAKDCKILLSVGRLVPRKGLAEFVDRAMPQLVKRDPRIMLIVAGGEANDALMHNASVLAHIRHTVSEHKLQDHVHLLGRITDETTLTTLYRESDVFVIPLVAQKDDVEGFGMVAVEAAAHGLPTVGFSLGGLPDAIETGRSGTLVEPDDYAAMTTAIFELLNNADRTGITAESCRAHAERFEWTRYSAQLHGICGRLHNRNVH